MTRGLIIKGIGGFYYVNTPMGLYECKVRGIFRKSDISPLPGDNVIFQIIDENSRIGNIEQILPRENILIRPAVANLDQIVIIISAQNPPTDFILLDKMLITADKKGIEPIICINKIDIDLDNNAEKIKMIYSSSKYKVISLSAKNDTDIQILEKELCQKVTVLAGQSGVGKSTILNKIMNSCVMEIGNLSKKIERGKHTTRHAEFMHLKSGGYLVDTPGFSSFELSDIEQTDLKDYYPEFREYSGRCRFKQCVHINEPDCFIKDFSNNDISLERYSRYKEIYNNLKNKRKDRR